MILGVPDIQRLELGLIRLKREFPRCTLGSYFGSLKTVEKTEEKELPGHCQGDWLCDLIVGEAHVPNSGTCPCPCERLGGDLVAKKVKQMILTGRTID